MNNEKINEMESLDRYFAKGDKRRGEALVLVAEAFLLGKECSENKPKEEMAKAIMKTIKSREHKQHIGTLVRIYSYCKKQLNKPKENEKNINN